MRAHPRGCGRSVDRGTRGPGIEPRNTCPAATAAGGPGCRGCRRKPKATPVLPIWRGGIGPRAVRDPAHARKHLAREPGDPASFCAALGSVARRAHREAQGRTTMSHRRGKSDCCAVPKKRPNKAAGEAPAAAEAVEGRRQAKGNAIAARMSRRLERPGAVCGSSARTDLWRGCWVTGIPTLTLRVVKSLRLGRGTPRSKRATSDRQSAAIHR
jgi:hypothetical protein